MKETKPKEVTPKKLSPAKQAMFVYLGEKQRANTITPEEKRQRIKLAAQDFAARFKEDMKILSRG